jgi:hypothetical protein
MHEVKRETEVVIKTEEAKSERGTKMHGFKLEWIKKIK